MSRLGKCLFIILSILFLVAVIHRNYSSNQWKTYTNKEYGFEIKYPGNWHLGEKDSGSLFSFHVGNVKKYSEEISDESLANESYFGINIRKDDNPNKQDVEDWYNNNLKGNTSNEPRSKIITTIEGFPAIKIEVIEIKYFAHIFIARGANILEIIYPVSQPKFTNIYEQILSTFKFIR